MLSDRKKKNQGIHGLRFISLWNYYVQDGYKLIVMNIGFECWGLEDVYLIRWWNHENAPFNWDINFWLI